MNTHLDSIYYEFAMTEACFVGYTQVHRITCARCRQCNHDKSGRTVKRILAHAPFNLGTCFFFRSDFSRLKLISYVRNIAFCNKNIGWQCSRRWFPSAISTYTRRFFGIVLPVWSWEACGMWISPRISRRRRRLLLIPNDSLGSHFEKKIAMSSQEQTTAERRRFHLFVFSSASTRWLARSGWWRCNGQQAAHSHAHKKIYIFKQNDKFSIFPEWEMKSRSLCHWSVSSMSRRRRHIEHASRAYCDDDEHTALAARTILYRRSRRPCKGEAREKKNRKTNYIYFTRKR